MSDGALTLQALAGTSAAVSLIPAAPNINVAKAFAAVAAVSATLDLVFKFADRARLHDDICKRFTRLAAEVSVWPADDEYLRRAQAKRLEIELDEPTVRRLIEIRASNEECRARGVEDKGLVPLTWLQRSLVGYFVSFGVEEALVRWERRKAK